MTKVTYIAFLEHDDDDSGVSVYFPDLDGCASWGADLDEAVRNAHEALALHLEGMSEEGLARPAPAALGKLSLHMTQRILDGLGPVTYAAITVEAPEASERVNIYLSKGLLERVEAHCAAHSINRSNFFAEAAREKLPQAASGPPPSVRDIAATLQRDMSALSQALRAASRPIADAGAAIRNAGGALGQAQALSEDAVEGATKRHVDRD